MRRSLRRRAGKSKGSLLNSAFIEQMEQRILLSTFVVTSTGDGGVSGDGSLRSAIIGSNATPGQNNIIDFDIAGTGVQTIEPLSQLPVISEHVTINGFSQGGPGYAGPPLIVLDGQNAGPASGLDFLNTATGSSVQGLVVNQFDVGIEIDGTTGVVIAGNYIGTDATGATSATNNVGVLLDLGARDNTIGGITAAARNVISGNGTGVEIGSTSGASRNTVEGNYIGTDATGTAALGNLVDGIAIDPGSFNNLIGGPTAAARNVISGNRGIGVGITGPDLSTPQSMQNLVEGNYIGTDVTGTEPIRNDYGVFLSFGASDNSIGGASPADGNVIAYNAAEGVVIANIPGDITTVEDDVRLNSIFANGGVGIDFGNTGVTTPDSPGGPHAGPNDLQNFPALSSAVTNGATTTITGGLNSTANSGFVIDFYSNPTQDADGSLQGKTYIGSEFVTTDNNGNATINVTLSASVPIGDYVTATATTTAESPYGDTSEFAAPVQDVGLLVAPTIQLSAPNVTYDGLSHGATALVLGAGTAVIGTATFTYYQGSTVSGTALGGAPVNAGTYTVLASFAGGNGYVAESATATFTIGQAALTITASNQTRTYGSANLPLVVTYAGFVDSQTSAVLTTQPKVTTTATQSSNVGSYTIHVSGAVDPNYAITYVSGTLKITKAVLTVTVNNTTKSQGHANPAFTVSYAGFVLGQGPYVLGGSVDFTTTAKKNSAKGKYAVDVSGLTSSNYTIDYVPGTLKIT